MEERKVEYFKMQEEVLKGDRGGNVCDFPRNNKRSKNQQSEGQNSDSDNKGGGIKKETFLTKLEANKLTSVPLQTTGIEDYFNSDISFDSELSHSSGSDHPGLKKEITSSDCSPASTKVSMNQEIVQKFDDVRSKIANDNGTTLMFLFASPLIHKFGNSKKPEVMPQLNFRKEFNEIESCLQECSLKVNYKKKVATIDNLPDIMIDNPSVLHFSGHGVRNTKENIGKDYVFTKNEGDMLVFEDSSLNGVLISAKKLKGMLDTFRTQIQVVVILSCHSEFVGEIFAKAGIPHVVCIKQTEKISDEASIVFARNFYRTLFQRNVCNPCQAFDLAVEAVKLQGQTKKLGKGEYLKFIHKKDHDSKQCSITIMFKEGEAKMINQEQKIGIPPAIVENFIGREIDSHEIISMINSNRLVCIEGIPGIGKSAIVKQICNILYERHTFRDGVLYNNLRGCTTLEGVIKKVYSTIKMFRIGSNQGFEHKDFSQVDIKDLYFELIPLLNRLKILIVLDNCSEIIATDSSSFTEFINVFLERMPHSKIMISCEKLRENLKDVKKCAYKVKELSDRDTHELMKLNADSNEKFSKEMKDLISYDPSLYAQLKKDKFKHEIFRFLNGHPLSINILCSLRKSMTLLHIFQFIKNFKEANFSEEVDPTTLSLTLNVYTSLDSIKKESKATYEALILLAISPSGFLKQDLEKIYPREWSSCEQRLLSMSMIQSKPVYLRDSLEEDSYSIDFTLSKMVKMLVHPDELSEAYKLFLKTLVEIVYKSMTKSNESENLLLFYENSIWSVMEKYYIESQSILKKNESEFFSNKEFTEEIMSENKSNKNLKRLRTFRNKIGNLNGLLLRKKLGSSELDSAETSPKKKEETKLEPTEEPTENKKEKDFTFIKGLMSNIISKKFFKEKTQIKSPNNNQVIEEEKSDREKRSDTEEDSTETPAKTKNPPGKKNFMDVLTKYCVNVSNKQPLKEGTGGLDRTEKEQPGATMNQFLALPVTKDPSKSAKDTPLLSEASKESFIETEIKKVSSHGKPALSKAAFSKFKIPDKNFEEYEKILIFYTANLIIRNQSSECFKVIQKYGLNCAEEADLQSQLYLTRNIMDKNYSSALSRLGQSSMHYLFSVALYRSKDLDFDIDFALQEIDEAIKILKQTSRDTSFRNDGLAVCYLWRAFLISESDHEFSEDEEELRDTDKNLDLFHSHILHSKLLPSSSKFKQLITQIRLPSSSESSLNLDIFVELILKVQDSRFEPRSFATLFQSRRSHLSSSTLKSAYNKSPSERKALKPQLEVSKAQRRLSKMISNKMTVVRGRTGVKEINQAKSLKVGDQWKENGPGEESQSQNSMDSSSTPKAYQTVRGLPIPRSSYYNSRKPYFSQQKPLNFTIVPRRNSKTDNLKTGRQSLSSGSGFKYPKKQQRLKEYTMKTYDQHSSIMPNQVMPSSTKHNTQNFQPENTNPSPMSDFERGKNQILAQIYQLIKNEKLGLSTLSVTTEEKSTQTNLF
ncbi:unnamed protein product [Moneuplotes crassus]|uniref:CHAT domain-containing protein n=1 Tax=Euplotes crassus TaxID=5936 RepID=A0AAD2D167_EUPCR|nr:unnamed protein product [Moneuplotes crassus]